MGIEIERKFLVVGEGWRNEVQTAIDISQGYVVITPEVSVRIRVSGDDAWITLKGRREGSARSEFEYSIPASEAAEMVALYAGDLIQKVRHFLARGPAQWTVDVFHGANEGLVLLEVEGEHLEAIELPSWVGREVTERDEYSNAALSTDPVSGWSNQRRISGGLHG